MNRKAVTLILFVLFTAVSQAQLTPQEAAQGMQRGINIGNTMEPPTEGGWGIPPVQERCFDDYKNAGFTAIRIPITWDGHTSTTPPYTIDSAWLSRVEQVVDWGLKRGLIIIINAHHESWIKNSFTAANLARFDSIWSQVSSRLQNKSDSLIFEIINEPYPMSEANVDSLNAATLKVIRMTNPTRIVSFSGYMWSNSDQLVIAKIPDPTDKYLLGYYHSYDPYPFGLIGTGSYGSASDINATKARFDQVTTWSTQHKIPVMLGEFGYIDTADYNSRMCAYATVVDQSLVHGVPAFAWDDGGDFPVYNRQTGGFNEVKDILVHTYHQSPNGMKISQTGANVSQVRWHNRNTEQDSITVERKVGSGLFFPIAQIGSSDSVFSDSSTFPGKSYYYRVSFLTKDSVLVQSYPVKITPVVTIVQAVGSPLRYELFNNYPNPFNPTTTIQFTVPVRSTVSLRIFDPLGRAVAILEEGVLPAGVYTRTWNASGEASGVYFCRLQAGTFAQTKKLILLR